MQLPHPIHLRMPGKVHARYSTLTARRMHIIICMGYATIRYELSNTDEIEALPTMHNKRATTIYIYMTVQDHTHTWQHNILLLRHRSARSTKRSEALLVELLLAKRADISGQQFPAQRTAQSAKRKAKAAQPNHHHLKTDASSWQHAHSS